MKPINVSKLNEALSLLNEHLFLDDAPATEIVVCGGSALIATGLVPRTTQDVDIVALMKAEVLVDSEPLPDYLLAAADRGGYHVSDLKALNPTTEELVAAAKWCLTQDTSEAFRMILKDMFNQLGWQNVSAQI